MDQFYKILEIIALYSDDHALYLKICNISKRARQIAKENFLSFNFTRSKVNDEYLSLLRNLNINKVIKECTHISVFSIFI